MEDRRNHVVQGCLGPIRTIRPFTTEEVAERLERGVGTPLDLMPTSYWWEPGQQYPRFGEEMLGADF